MLSVAMFTRNIRRHCFFMINSLLHWLFVYWYIGGNPILHQTLSLASIPIYAESMKLKPKLANHILYFENILLPAMRTTNIIYLHYLIFFYWHSIRWPRWGLGTSGVPRPAQDLAVIEPLARPPTWPLRPHATSSRKCLIRRCLFNLRVATHQADHLQKIFNATTYPSIFYL